MRTQLALIPPTEQEQAEQIYLQPHEWANRGAFFARLAAQRTNSAAVANAYGAFTAEKRLKDEAIRMIDTAMSALRRAREGLV